MTLGAGTSRPLRIGRTRTAALEVSHPIHDSTNSTKSAAWWPSTATRKRPSWPTWACTRCSIAGRRARASAPATADEISLPQVHGPRGGYFHRPRAGDAARRAGHRPHPLFHRRRYRAAQRAAVFGGLQQGAAWRSRTTATSPTPAELRARSGAPRLHLPGQQRHRSGSAPGGAFLGAHPGRRAARALLQLEGAFSLVFLAEDRIIVARDPHGFRPLAVGEMEISGGRKCYVFASETCAFDLIGAVYLHDVDPGEMVIVGPEGVTRERYAPEQPRAQCVFEHVYFSRPDSIVFGRAGAGIAREPGPPAGARMPRRRRPGGAGARIRAWPRPSAIPPNPAFPSATRSSAITTWAARSSSLRRPSAISESS